jgi:hypothetical protein
MCSSVEASSSAFGLTAGNSKVMSLKLVRKIPIAGVKHIVCHACLPVSSSAAVEELRIISVPSFANLAFPDRAAMKVIIEMMGWHAAYA